MKSFFQVRTSWVLAASLVLGGNVLMCQAQAATKAAGMVVTDGTPVQLKLGRTVSSESDQPGEVVEFVLKKDLMAGTTVLVPAGTSVYGEVISAQLEDRNTGAGGTLEFRLESLKLANGQEIPLRTIPQLPTQPNADLRPEMLVNLVNSPYAPYAHFNDGKVTTVPKEMSLTLYVAADVNISSQPVVVARGGAVQMDSVAAHIVHSNAASTSSLGDIARQQRERGKIGGGLISTQ